MVKYEIKKPDKKNLKGYWDAAIGLQRVDELTPSEYLLELSEKNIAGELDNNEIEDLLYRKYEDETPEEKLKRKKESDIVTNRIAELLGMDGQTLLTPNYLRSLHGHLFKDIYEYAGKFRNCNIFKREAILNGETVNYSNYYAIQSTLEYDMSEERKKNYKHMARREIVKNISNFTSAIWQVHPFMEGNTRTTALFIEQYLNGIGFKTDNSLFKENSQFFRNSLVRANYADLEKGICSDDKYLRTFLVNLLFNGEYELQSKQLMVRECFSSQKLDFYKQGKESKEWLQEMQKEHDIDR